MNRRCLQKLAGLLLVAAAGLLAAPQTEAAANIIVWDTATRLGPAADVADRTGWKPVPTDLLALEADPAKASSDPGYYGREYSFEGDAVVENRSLLVVFRSDQGRVVIYSNAGMFPPGNDSSGNPAARRKFAELLPLETATDSVRLDRFGLLRNAEDEVLVEASFSAPESKELTAIFAFDKTGIIGIKPAANMKGIRLNSPIEYGIVPGFIGDDLIFGGTGSAPDTRLHVPAESLFLGLIEGGDAELVLTWPAGEQRLSLQVGAGQSGQPLFQSIDFDNDGRSLYLAVLEAPGLWHREELKPIYLEKDVTISWLRPFPAKWTTQLYEGRVKTTFAFRTSPGQIWRGVPGMYRYPVWFDGDHAFYHLSKKVPPRGESLIYFVEGQNTPPSIMTPVDILKATLGRDAADDVLDPSGRKLRTHHRRGGESVHRACTCGFTEAIQAVFEAGHEVERKEFVRDAVGDMTYFVECHLTRIDEYRRFADDLIRWLQTQAKVAPGSKDYLENLERIARQIPEECDVQKENMRSLEFAGELAAQTLALTGRKNPNNLDAYLELFKTWRAMGGAQDYVIAQCHTIARRLFQEAGYGGAEHPEALLFAKEVRKRCRQVLRNPDGYEIWANY